MRGTMTGAMGFFVDALATYRFVKLIRDDKITEPLRDAVEARQGPAERSKTTCQLHCPWCLSFSFGTALTLGRLRWPRSVDVVARSFALSAAVGIASQHLDAD